MYSTPLGALISRRTTNLLAAGKNIGTTHITNGAYRLHPVEWNAGGAAASLTALPILVVFVLAQRQFIQGLAHTGLKG
jgi:ABC-type glycerol-3-phosphate transport system permease component